MNKDDLTKNMSFGAALSYCILAGLTDWFHVVQKPPEMDFWISVGALGVVIGAIVKVAGFKREDSIPKPDSEPPHREA